LLENNSIKGFLCNTSLLLSSTVTLVLLYTGSKLWC